jgi:hypothetical protein
MGWRTGDARPSERHDRKAWTPHGLRLPRLTDLDLEGAEARKVELWGRHILRSVEAWEHREKRRREGRGGGV